MEGIHLVAGGRIRCDHRYQHDHAVPGQQFGHEPDSPDVGVPVLAGESQPGGQPPAQLVAVEYLHGPVQRPAVFGHRVGEGPVRVVLVEERQQPQCEVGCCARCGGCDLGYRFLEPWIYPMGPEFTFVKAFEWEVREFPPTSERIVAPEGMCVELKWLDQDEFAHWRDTAFDPVRTPRKARELEVNRALHEGRGHEIEGLKRIEAPAGVHVVDYVTRQWMQLEPRPLTLRLELQELA